MTANATTKDATKAKAMTNPLDRKKAPATARQDPGELRWWITAGLATTYLVAWWAFAPAQVSDAPAPTGLATEADVTAPPVAAAAPRSTPPGATNVVLWWHELPLALRPKLELPAGWQVATPDRRAAPTIGAQRAWRPTAAYRTVAQERRRRPRVRTRSS